MLIYHLFIVILFAQILDGQFSRKRASNSQPALVAPPRNTVRQARQGLTSVFVSRQRPANANFRPMRVPTPQSSLPRRPFSQPPVALPPAQRRAFPQPPPRQRSLPLPPANRFNEMGSMPSLRPPKGVAAQLNRAKLKDFMSLGSFLMQRRRSRLFNV